ncbi:glycoside hydrolase family 65 protein [Pseudomonas sp. OIL-1]|uniref:glycoside hydrolase family 65 protein n=1 Tax=Pseudomonas sp. OIL-1 TaxID=2706126 RepID=UPI0013A764E6|nr:glycoside hydrolase family 65 protein [Pseudomonas sp. OIL-1]QIB49850.1 glycoside hydrolase family 65 protein [Pseudomonas sp. OIL-1]
MSDVLRAGWRVEFDHYDPEDELRREALLALGNGLLSCRTSAPEAAALLPRHDWQQTRYAGFYRAGWYDEAPREVNGKQVTLGSLVNLPDPFGLSISLDGECWFGADANQVRDYRQSLDVRNGLAQRDICFELQGQTVRLRETRLLSMASPELALLRWELTLPEGLQRLHLRATLDGAVTNSLIARNQAYEGPRLRNVCYQCNPTGLAAVSASLHTPDRHLAMAVRTFGDKPLVWHNEEHDGRLLQHATIELSGARQLTLEKRVVVRVDDDLPSDSRLARSLVIDALPAEPFDLLLRHHRKAWRRLWARMPMRAAQAGTQLTLRLHAYHLAQTVSPHSIGHDLGCPPRGWHEGYYGQVFWDEIFAFPFISTHFPELGLELLDYRYRRLDTARQRARRLGLGGAMYPWRSARSGEDETPPFQCYPPSGSWVPDYTFLQRHIGAAVAYDVWTLYLATGDMAMLAGFGGEMIVEIARFWASRAHYEESHGRFCIRGVVGPDEYHNHYPDSSEPGLDNNSYTNIMATWTLTCGLQLVNMLPAEQAAALRQRTDLSAAELAHWEHVSRRMYLHFNDEGALSPFEGFEQLRTPPEEWLTDNHPRLDWMLEGRGDTTERYQLSKQADTLMLLYLFSPPVLKALLERLGYSADDGVLQRTLDYQLRHITHESSLSKVVCAGALAYHRPEESWEYFMQALNVDLTDDPNRGTLEGVHLGAMAGSLDVLQRHYLGVQPQPDGLHLLPSVPTDLDRVSLDFCYRGLRLRITLHDDEVSLLSRDSNPEAVQIFHANGQCVLQPGESVSVSARSG